MILKLRTILDIRSDLYREFEDYSDSINMYIHKDFYDRINEEDFNIDDFKKDNAFLYVNTYNLSNEEIKEKFGEYDKEKAESFIERYYIDFKPERKYEVIHKHIMNVIKQETQEIFNRQLVYLMSNPSHISLDLCMDISRVIYRCTIYRATIYRGAIYEWSFSWSIRFSDNPRLRKRHIISWFR